LKDLFGRSKTLLRELIEGAVRIKAEIVAEDETEQDIRRLLNFGHTFGHTLENLLGYGTLLHGEAVILGMRIASALSLETGIMAEPEFERAERLLEKIAVPATKRLGAKRVYGQIWRDKKVKDGKTVYVLLKTVGEGVIRSDINKKTVRSCIESVLNR
jgi:3-dehydroquinate synthase